MKKSLPQLRLFLVSLFALTLAACGGGEPPQDMPPPIVSTIVVETRPVHLEDELPGRVSALRTAVIVALSRDKDAARLLPVVARFAGALICVRADPVRGASAEDLRRLSRHPRAAVAADINAALARARRLAGANGLVCVCGSFAAAGQARTLMRRERRAR